MGIFPLVHSFSWDHPRIRGTNLEASMAALSMAGSSPHTRDKSREFAESQKALGIIPAYAGQMQDYILQLPLAQDHPRIRGTNTIYELTEDYLRGSSPHTRDKCRFSASSIACFRIIPAYAGQIFRFLDFCTCGQDHPRIRGTNNRNFRKGT